MNESMREEMQDRMLEAALEEKLGAVKAPDIAAKLGAKPELKVERPKVLASRTSWWARIVIAGGIATVALIVVDGVNQHNREADAVRMAEAGNDKLKSARELRGEDDDSGLETSPGYIACVEEPVEAQEPSILDAPDLEGLKKSPALARLEPSDDSPNVGARAAPAMGAGGGLSPGQPWVRGGNGGKGRASVAKAVPIRRNDYRFSRTNESAPDLDESHAASLGPRVALGERQNAGKDADGERRPSGFEQQDDVQYFDNGDRSSAGNRYAQLNDNPFQTATAAPLSTFSIDVDTASYSVLRTLISSGRQIPPPAVRIEELVNYFPYEYAQPADGAPFAVHSDVAGCPWNGKHRLVRIALKGREIAKENRPPSNLVFLVDVSGSMGEPNKLPLVQQGLRRLVEQLDERDRVAIVVYAGNSGCVLPSTVCTGENKQRITASVAALASGGSTNGEAGIQLAYQIAQDHFVKDGSNRVILCTDGDFNVGTTSVDELKSMVADRAKRTGVFFTALGFGMGNLNDHLLESIADNGNGAYGYIDNEREVEKLFVKQLSGTLVTIAKDVKIQIEFNPALVAGYRLIGYENRMLKKEDFNNDAKDAGDIGAGHTVTALYEIVPAGQAIDEPAKEGAKAGDAGGAAGVGAAGENGKAVDDLEFQKPKAQLEVTDAAKASGDMMVVKLRYKAPDGDRSTLIRQTLKDAGTTFAAASSDFKFAASVAAFGMILRRSPYRGDISLSAVEEIAAANVGADQGGLRAEFVGMVRAVKTGGRE